ncbi:type II toxin-antitoxin system HicA family toxin [Peptostreptococcus equinus]|uniref:Type II toxin-antitoxin system HicA family toxin n=1 Tax=Peptostreptococcus equinus TaxID=3003601 RepID=A0ABY7JQR1_9FIRM|nr:type II toxin-antitoxin system HicA family toxin [Peptostreptococcus sp. CBA3647]WAW15440.1 type II toxin-antitoxin system HicA family toxin [Peptostreptococcus sp. CBA3647]
MKHRDLIKLLESNGFYYKRAGGNHDIYTNGTISEPIPRHKEINEMLARKIIKKLGLK